MNLAEVIRSIYYDGALITWMIWVPLMVVRAFVVGDWASGDDPGAGTGLVIAAALAGLAWPVGGIVMPAAWAAVIYRRYKLRCLAEEDQRQRELAPYLRELEAEL